MNIRWSLGTLAAVVFATIPIFVDAPFDSQMAIAQEAPALTSEPSIDAAPPDRQSAPAACEQTCRAEYDRQITFAADRLKNQKYSPSNNCFALWSDKPGVPLACSVTYYSCVDQCKDGNCINRCMVTLQPCCHANDVENRKHDLSLCLAACPPARPRLMGCVQPAPSEGGGARGGPAGEAPWTTLLKQMNAMMGALGPRVEGLDLQQFDNVRRNLAFMQVSAQLKESGRKFAVVSGRSGRLWVVLADGRSFLIDPPVALSLQNQLFTESPYEIVAKQTGLTNFDVLSLANTLVDAHNKGVEKPGNVFYFPEDSIRCWQLGSSEHSSVRGTINGAGDFI